MKNEFQKETIKVYCTRRSCSIRYRTRRPFLYLGTPPFDPSFRRNRFSYTSELCLALKSNRGLITPTLRMTHTPCTFRRRLISPECSLPRCSMVRPRHLHLHVCLFVNILFVWFILGVVIILSFQCIAALFNPAHRKGEPIKWGLVSYTAVTFTLATVFTTINLAIQVASYIDNRAVPGVEDLQIPPGPFGYILALVAPGVALSAVFALSNWLADGLLVSSLFDVSFIHPGV